MDLSKAFDCLPHNLLLLKLEAYGLSKNSLKLLQSYLENRKQGIKIGSYYSDCDQMCKRVSQGSILQPVLFNIFINDIFLFGHVGWMSGLPDTILKGGHQRTKQSLVPIGPVVSGLRMF
jgi:hypothetical protein